MTRSNLLFAILVCLFLNDFTHCLCCPPNSHPHSLSRQACSGDGESEDDDDDMPGTAQFTSKREG